jgi:hypothetical protein
MEESTTAVAFAETLRARMNSTVTDYGEILRIDRVIDGTAVFPGGTGLWRSREPHGALPSVAPQAPFFILAHNFDKYSNYCKSLDRGCEDLDADFWAFLLLYLRGANIEPSECFFTNAIMGLQTKRAQGPLLGGGSKFDAQCQHFLQEQIDFTAPRAIIVLGDRTKKRLAALHVNLPSVALRHPSSFYSVTNEMKQPVLDEQIRKLSNVVGRGISEVSIPPRYAGNHLILLRRTSNR